MCVMDSPPPCGQIDVVTGQTTGQTWWKHYASAAGYF